jgi:hypothetical protein
MDRVGFLFLFRIGSRGGLTMLIVILSALSSTSIEPFGSECSKALRRYKLCEIIAARSVRILP